jgi:hypothetical protein
LQILGTKRWKTLSNRLNLSLMSNQKNGPK